MGEDNSSIDKQKEEESEQKVVNASHNDSAINPHSNETDQPQSTNEPAQQAIREKDQSGTTLKRQETDENKLVTNREEDLGMPADDLIHEDPHTSFLQLPASDKQQYTTPSKSLPPLKDQEPIVTLNCLT